MRAIGATGGLSASAVQSTFAYVGQQLVREADLRFMDY